MVLESEIVDDTDDDMKTDDLETARPARAATAVESRQSVHGDVCGDADEEVRSVGVSAAGGVQQAVSPVRASGAVAAAAASAAVAAPPPPGAPTATATATTAATTVTAAAAAAAAAAAVAVDVDVDAGDAASRAAISDTAVEDVDAGDEREELDDDEDMDEDDLDETSLLQYASYVVPVLLKIPTYYSAQVTWRVVRVPNFLVAPPPPASRFSGLV